MICNLKLKFFSKKLYENDGRGWIKTIKLIMETNNLNLRNINFLLSLKIISSNKNLVIAI